LLLKRSPIAKRSPGLWDFPGGSAKEGENVRDEAKEEIGLSMKAKEGFFDIYRYKDKDTGELITEVYFFEAKIAGKTEIKLSLEHTDFKWISIDSPLIWELELTPSVRAAVENL
jgi:8-oxo-dGTP pyrophosphatase MutT (NUDIX family)